MWFVYLGRGEGPDRTPATAEAVRLGGDERETKGPVRCRCRCFPEGLEAASADPVLADLRDKAGGGDDAGMWQDEGGRWGRGRGSLSMWFHGRLSMREEAGLGEPGLAKLWPGGAISCPGRGRAEAGQVEGRRARS
jgi:hypothetical protein